MKLGDIDCRSIDLDADIVFLYGILHHMKNPVRLLESASRMCEKTRGEVAVYTYNAESLRELIVEIARAATPPEAQLLDEFI